MPAVSISFSPTGAGSSPVAFWRSLGDGGAVGLHAHGVDDRVRAAPVGELADGAGEVVVGVPVEDLDPVAFGPFDAVARARGRPR